MADNGDRTLLRSTTHELRNSHTVGPSRPSVRRLPVGAEYQQEGKTHVRVWAPAVPSVDVVMEGDSAQGSGDPRFASPTRATAISAERSRRARAIAIAFDLAMAISSFQIRRRGFNPRALTVRHRSSTRQPFPGLTTGGREPRSADR